MTDGAVLLSTPTKSQQQEEHRTVFKLRISIPSDKRLEIASLFIVNPYVTHPNTFL